VGGGIAGITLAVGLQRRGIRLEILEKASEWQAIGAGIAVQRNGTRALRAVGLDERVARAGQILERWQFRSSAVRSDGETALDRYVVRRGPRVHWVQEQSRRLGEALRVPAVQRDVVLGERGEAMFCDLYAPRVPEP
jgi:flavin-dependent dehydrogenase